MIFYRYLVIILLCGASFAKAAQNGMSQSSPANGVSQEQFDKESKAKLARAVQEQSIMDTTQDGATKKQPSAKKNTGLQDVSTLHRSELYEDPCKEDSQAEQLYERFFALVNLGKIGELKEFFSKNAESLKQIDFDINCLQERDEECRGIIDYKGDFTPSLNGNLCVVTPSDTAYTLAHRKGHFEMADFLATQGADTNLNLAKYYAKAKYERISLPRSRKGQAHRKRFKGREDNYGSA